jgi:DNA-binding XRE family transcriptional regulator
MKHHEGTTSRNASKIAQAFGTVIRRRRRALQMRQVDLALATGVGRRFLVDLEAGKPSCQLGRSLLVANSLGLRVADLLESDGLLVPKAAGKLNDLPEFVEEPDGAPTSVL